MIEIVKRTAMLLAALAALGPVATPAPAKAAGAGEDCSKAVAQAFEKQRAAPSFRFAATMPSEAGATRMTIDYVRPDRMHQKVEAPGQPAPVETIAVGRWAWGTQGGGWEELQPQFAQSVVAHVHEALIAPPKMTGSFACLGTAKLDGAEVLAYRSVAREAAPANGGDTAEPELTRTIYVDPKTGLPVGNVVAAAGSESAPVFDGRYSYPTDIVIEAPIGPPK